MNLVQGTYPGSTPTAHCKKTPLCHCHYHPTNLPKAKPKTIFDIGCGHLAPSMATVLSIHALRLQIFQSSSAVKSFDDFVNNGRGYQIR